MRDQPVEVPTWDVRRVMQFDASGKLYFRGTTQNNPRGVFLQFDPSSASSNPWETACLYRYNPALPTVADRAQKLIECYRDGYSYVNGDPQLAPMQQPQPPTDEEVAALQLRCESEGQLFISGDSVTSLSQLDDGTLCPRAETLPVVSSC
jgi:hypothetical protein